MSASHKLRWLPAAACWQYRQTGIEPKDGGVNVLHLNGDTSRAPGEPQRFDNLTDALSWADYIDGMICASLFNRPDPPCPAVEPLP